MGTEPERNIHIRPTGAPFTVMLNPGMRDAFNRWLDQQQYEATYFPGDPREEEETYVLIPRHGSELERRMFGGRDG